MTRFTASLFALIFSTAALRADLVLEQQFSDTNRTRSVITKLHGDHMRMDQPDDGYSVLVNLATRDSFTLLTNKTYLMKFGSEVRWEMSEEKKHTGGTNEMDALPAPAVDTGKSGVANGYDAEIFQWSGALGLTERLWVAPEFPNYSAIRGELVKLDHFNETGPHPNAQPLLSVLPGMVVRSETTRLGHTVTNTLISAKLEHVDPELLKLPVDYTPWKAPNKSP
jgi:hypothetical protein